jgi:hypothetical protein
MHLAVLDVAPVDVAVRRRGASLADVDAAILTGAARRRRDCLEVSGVREIGGVPDGDLAPSGGVEPPPVGMELAVGGLDQVGCFTRLTIVLVDVSITRIVPAWALMM